MLLSVLLAILLTSFCTADFSQTVCPDSSCQGSGCVTTVFPEKSCLPLKDQRGSVSAYCVPSGLALTQTLFLTDTKCTGENITRLVPTHQCVPLIKDEGFITIICNVTTAPPTESPVYLTVV